MTSTLRRQTRFHNEGHIEEVAAGYSIYWKGKPATETHQSGVGFAIKSSIVKRLESTSCVGDVIDTDVILCKFADLCRLKSVGYL